MTIQKNLDFKNVVVWSQANCSACETAKKLLSQLNIAYTVKMLDSVETKQVFFHIFPGARSVPQITIDGKWIGGLQELKTYLNDNSKALKVV
jgi:glutaredoxin